MFSSDLQTETLQAVGDVPLVLRAELDRKTILFRDLLNLSAGNVISLSRPAGENVDLYAGEVRIGSGEILVIDSMLAVRLSDLGARSKPNEGSPTEGDAGN